MTKKTEPIRPALKNNSNAINSLLNPQPDGEKKKKKKRRKVYRNSVLLNSFPSDILHLYLTLESLDDHAALFSFSLRLPNTRYTYSNLNTKLNLRIPQVHFVSALWERGDQQRVSSCHEPWANPV